MRKLKHHEHKLLKKVDFLQVRERPNGAQGPLTARRPMGARSQLLPPPPPPPAERSHTQPRLPLTPPALSSALLPAVEE